MNIAKEDFVRILDAGLVPAFKKSSRDYRRQTGPFEQIILPRFISSDSPTAQCDLEFQMYPVGSWRCPFQQKVVSLDDSIGGWWRPHRCSSWSDFEELAQHDLHKIVQMLDHYVDPTEYLRYFDFLVPSAKWLAEVDVAISTGNVDAAATLWANRSTIPALLNMTHDHLCYAMAVRRLGQLLAIAEGDDWRNLARAALVFKDPKHIRYPTCHDRLRSELTRLLDSELSE